MKKLFIKILVIIFCLGGVTLMQPIAHAENTGNKMSFKLRIQRIQKEVVDLVDPFALIDSELFVEIWKNPRAYQQDVIKLIVDKKITEVQKEIAVLSMNNLPLNDFLKYCEIIIGLRKANKINNDVFLIAIFPGYDWNTKLQENYKEPKVRQLLLKIKGSELLPDKSTKTFDNKYIDEILSGKTLKHIEDLRSAGQIPQRPLILQK